jgi:hypothetical protein
MKQNGFVYLRDLSCACIALTVGSPDLFLCCDIRAIFTCWDAIGNGKFTYNPVTCGWEILFHEVRGLRDGSVNPAFT